MESLYLRGSTQSNLHQHVIWGLNLNSLYENILLTLIVSLLYSHIHKMKICEPLYMEKVAFGLSDVDEKFSHKFLKSQPEVLFTLSPY